MRRDTTYSMSKLYEFKMSVFDHGKPKEFLFFVLNLRMNLAVTGPPDIDAKIQYLRTLVRGEALRQFDLFSADVENT